MALKGRKFSDEHRLKLRATNQGKLGEKKPNYGKGKPVLQHTLDGELIGSFCNSREASEKADVGATSIQKCCKGKQASAGGYIWRYV